MPGASDTTLDDFTPELTTEELSLTIRCPAETSNTKNEALETAVEELQSMAAYMGDMLPSVPEYEWSHQNTTLYRMVVAEFDDRTVKSKVALEAMKHALDSYLSWRERGRDGDRPDLGNGSFFVLPSQDYEIVENDRGYGLKAGFIPYQTSWFHLDVGEYQEEYLAEIVDDASSTTTGTVEFRLENDGSLNCHIVVNREIEVYEAADVNRSVGVDLGESTLYTVAVVDGPDDVTHVEMESGDEFRHYRDRLEQKRKRLAEQGDLDGVRRCRGERERYTEQVCHTASRRIVDVAAEYAPAVIHLEDLTYYRETADDPIHDWPFALLQEYVMYKARGAGIPVVTVDPAETSITCRHCGQSTPEFRQGDTFYCRRCGYEVHADVNGAINIALATRE